MIDKTLNYYMKKAKIVTKLLNEYDLANIGINKNNEDEYVSEAINITMKLTPCFYDKQGKPRNKSNTARLLFKVIDEVFIDSLGSAYYKNDNNLLELSWEIIRDLSEFNKTE